MQHRQRQTHVWVSKSDNRLSDEFGQGGPGVCHAGRDGTDCIFMSCSSRRLEIACMQCVDLSPVVSEQLTYT